MIPQNLLKDRVSRKQFLHREPKQFSVRGMQAARRWRRRGACVIIGARERERERHENRYRGRPTAGARGSHLLVCSVFYVRVCVTRESEAVDSAWRIFISRCARGIPDISRGGKFFKLLFRHWGSFAGSRVSEFQRLKKHPYFGGILTYCQDGTTINRFFKRSGER